MHKTNSGTFGTFSTALANLWPRSGPEERTGPVPSSHVVLHVGQEDSGGQIWAKPVEEPMTRQWMCAAPVCGVVWCQAWFTPRSCASCLVMWPSSRVFHLSLQPSPPPSMFLILTDPFTKTWQTLTGQSSASIPVALPSLEDENTGWLSRWSTARRPVTRLRGWPTSFPTFVCLCFFFKKTLNTQARFWTL